MIESHCYEQVCLLEPSWSFFLSSFPKIIVTNNQNKSETWGCMGPHKILVLYHCIGRSLLTLRAASSCVPDLEMLWWTIAHTVQPSRKNRPNREWIGRVGADSILRSGVYSVLYTRNPPGIKYSTKPKCGPIYGSLQYWDKPKCERARPFLYFPCAHNLDIPSPA